MSSYLTHQELADRIVKLSEKYRHETWRVDKEPHDYPDGTSHFNHVRYTSTRGADEMTVEIASYVTPELGELLCLLQNNLDRLTAGLRCLPNSQAEGKV